MIKTTCNCCKKESLETENNPSVKELLSHNWDIIYNTSNGIDFTPYCPTCIKSIKKNLKIYQNNIKN